MRLDELLIDGIWVSNPYALTCMFVNSLVSFIAVAALFTRRGLVVSNHIRALAVLCLISCSVCISVIVPAVLVATDDLDSSIDRLRRSGLSVSVLLVSISILLICIFLLACKKQAKRAEINGRE